MKKIKLMADYGCYPLWGTTPEDFGDINPESLPISEGLKNKLYQWAGKFDSILNDEDPISSDFNSNEDKLAFIQEGYELAKELQAELGSGYEITYHSID